VKSGVPTDCPHSGWPAHSPENSPEKPHTIEFLVDRNRNSTIIDRRRDRRGETEEDEQSATEAVAAEEVAAEEVAACRAPGRRATVNENVKRNRT
jgi:hypothetical protein